MTSIDALTAEWTALSPAHQLAQWETFIADLDAGAAGFHRYYRVLMPLWDQGDVPDLINDAHLARSEAEMQAEALGELHHPRPTQTWMDDGIRQPDPSTAEIDLIEPPY